MADMVKIHGRNHRVIGYFITGSDSSRELIDALLAHDFLECIECDASTRIDNQADYTNKK